MNAAALFLDSHIFVWELNNLFALGPHGNSVMDTPINMVFIYNVFNSIDFVTWPVISKEILLTQCIVAYSVLGYPKTPGL
jgi:hypothetical protein